VDIVTDGIDEGESEFFFVEISAAPSLANVTDATAIGVILEDALVSGRIPRRTPR
jgi:hypothetical protein